MSDLVVGNQSVWISTGNVLYFLFLLPKTFIFSTLLSIVFIVPVNAEVHYDQILTVKCIDTWIYQYMYIILALNPHRVWEITLIVCK